MRKTVTLPKQTWDKIVILADSMEAGISDALFAVVDLGLRALKNDEALELLDEDEDEEDKVRTILG